MDSPPTPTSAKTPECSTCDESIDPRSTKITERSSSTTLDSSSNSPLSPAQHFDTSGPSTSRENPSTSGSALLTQYKKNFGGRPTTPLGSPKTPTTDDESVNPRSTTITERSSSTTLDSSYNSPLSPAQHFDTSGPSTSRENPSTSSSAVLTQYKELLEEMVGVEQKLVGLPRGVQKQLKREAKNITGTDIAKRFKNMYV